MAERNFEDRLRKITSSGQAAAHPFAFGALKGRRQIARESAYIMGTIRYGGDQIVRCIVVDLTAFGAKVTLQGAGSLPQLVHLSVPGRAISKAAQVRWQRDQEAGLCF